MKKNKNIALLCASLSRGGAERVLISLAKYFKNNGYDAKIITSYKVDNEYEIPEGIKRINLTGKINSSGNFISRTFGSIKELRKTIKKEDIDILIIMGTPNCIYGITGSIFTKAKVIVSERNDPRHFTGKRSTKFLSRFLMKFADRFVFQTEDAKKFYDKQLKGRGTVIHNPILVDNLPEFFTGDREKTIVSMGRLNPQKNQKMLIDAFAEISEKIPEYKLIIYGEGSLRNDLESQIKELHLEDKISLPGNFLDVHERIKKASLFVMSSDFEGMPNALIEAMALGLPCISTDCPCGGPKELIENNKNGVLVPVNDESALVKQMLKIINNKEYATSISKEAVKIKNHLDIKNIGKQWEDYII